MAQPPVLGADGLELAGLQLETAQLLDLVTQEVALARALGRGAPEPGRRRPRALPGLPSGAKLRQALPRACEVVQDLALGIAAQERLMGVLAVDLHEELADVAQALHGDRPPVDEGPRAAVAADGPAQHAGPLGVGELELGEARLDRGQAGGLEDGGDLGALAAGAHDARARPVPQDETERVEQNRLAGAGLAREHGHPRADLEGHPLDDGQVADLELGQHYSSLAQCSFVRRVAK